MTVTPNQLLETAASGKGDTYVFGGEVRLDDPNPDRYDCSEYVQWVCHQNGLTVPDGAFNQWRFCEPIDVRKAISTPGALLFVGDGTGSGRDAITHVAFSRGNGRTWEARGAQWGVDSWSAIGRFQFAGLIPGVDYSTEDFTEMEAQEIIRQINEHTDARVNAAAEATVTTLVAWIKAVDSAEIDEAQVAAEVVAKLGEKLR